MMKKSTTKKLYGELFIHNSGIAIKEHDCFLCTTRVRSLLHYALVCDVQDPNSGRRIIDMFKVHNDDAKIVLVTNTDGITGTQVVIGACETHYGRLLQLCNLTKDNRLTEARLAEVVKV